MSLIDNINCAKTKLIESLGEKHNDYLKLMRTWYKMKWTKEELKAEIAKLLTPDQIHLHNQLLLSFLDKCVRLTVEETEETENPITRKKYSSFQGNFEPIDPTQVTVTERQEVDAEAPACLVQDQLLPDRPFILSRLMYGAWELGLEGASTPTADLLLIATLQFLKNILTAIVCWRKSYKINNHFVHALGDPVPNPWLRNVARHKQEEHHCLKIDPNDSEILVPNERLTQEEYDQEQMFKLASSDLEDNILPISAHDLVATLKIYPNLLASNFILTVNCERIMARICHPSWDY